jgi:hypothetical protein
MPPRLTRMHAEAQDAFEPTLESAGALTFVNDASGSAAPPAPYHAVAARQLACVFLTLSPTLQEVRQDTSPYGCIGGVRRHRLG